MVKRTVDALSRRCKQLKHNIGCFHHHLSVENFHETRLYTQGRSQDFSKGGAEVMEAKALKRKNCL